MPDLFFQLLFLILAYLIGSIPTGFLIGKSKGIDIRNHGSNNIGATNTARTLGKKYFILVIFLDGLKGFIFVFLFRFGILPHEWCLLSPVLYGISATLGHVFPIYLKFKGGKAVSTGAGVALGYSPIICIIGIIAFIITHLILLLNFKLLYKIEIKGDIDLSNDKGYIICSNHIHMFDPIFIACFTNLTARPPTQARTPTRVKTHCWQLQPPH